MNIHAVFSPDRLLTILEVARAALAGDYERIAEELDLADEVLQDLQDRLEQYLAQTDPEADPPLYVVVDLTQRYSCCPQPGEFYLPGDEPHTWGALDDAAWMVAELIELGGLTVATAPVYQLVPVPQEQIAAAVARVQARMAEET